MANDIISANDMAAGVVTLPGQPGRIYVPKFHEAIHKHDLIGVHHVVVRDARGKVVFVQDIPNIVTTAGKNYLLGAGLAGTPSAITAWYLGMLNENRHVSDGVIASQPTTTFSSAT